MLKAASVAALAAFAYRAFGPRPNPAIPDHLLNLPIVYTEGLIQPADLNTLQSLVKGYKDYRTVVDDLAFYRTVHEHIGEAQPIVNGSCPHPMLIPNINNRSECILPGRVDVARHWILTGGVEGLKEKYEGMVSRVQAFSRYMFELPPAINDLFASASFQAGAKAVCPADAPILHPFQFNIIINLPGQTVALHTDAPYFKRASRFAFPQWLLVAMVHSGLFQQDFIHQVQAVAYLHSWDDVNGTRKGDFVYWSEAVAAPKSVPSKPGSGSFVDGSKVVHAATVYMPHQQPPMLDKSKKNTLEYTGQAEDVWQLKSDGQLLRSYTTDDLRISLVYRAMCFKSEGEKEDYLASRERGEHMPLSEILDTFKADLAAKGKRTRKQLDAMPMLEFALLLIDSYIVYPVSHTALVPYNYCAISALFPSLAPVVDLVC